MCPNFWLVLYVWNPICFGCIYLPTSPAFMLICVPLLLQAKEKYEKSLDELSKCTPTYQESMEQVFDQCQQHEVRRLTFLKEVMLDIKRHLNLTENQRSAFWYPRNLQDRGQRKLLFPYSHHITQAHTSHTSSNHSYPAPCLLTGNHLPLFIFLSHTLISSSQPRRISIILLTEYYLLNMFMYCPTVH